MESGADSTQPEKTVSEGTDSIDPTEPTEPTEPPDIPDTQDDYAVLSVGSTQKSILLFDYADNGNYTTVLKSQVSCEYKPNGTGAARTAYIKNLGWHFARYGGVAYPDEPLYCIEPWRSNGASTSGNSVDRGVTLDGSGSTAGSNVWYAMPEDYREAIGLILLYSDQMWDHSVSVTTTKKDSNPNVPLRIATQFLIYEIVCGLRDPATFKSNSVNSCGTSGDIFYNAGEASVPYFAPKYNALVDAIHAAKKIPSFTGASVSSAPTITLTGEETSVTDSNGVLFNFSFTDGNGAKFYKSGNTLYITQTGDISESTVYKEMLLMKKFTNRAVFFCDELGTMPPFDILPLFSAGRSRWLTLVPIIQSLAQLEKNYGKEGAEILADNCQDTIFGGFAPNSQTAEVLSRNLGSRTVLSGSVTQGKDSNSQSLQMMERPLMSPDELKSMPKGSFVIMKNGTHPMKTKLKLFLDWGIRFEKPLKIPDRGSRPVHYAGKAELEQAILSECPLVYSEEPLPPQTTLKPVPMPEKTALKT